MKKFITVAIVLIVALLLMLLEGCISLSASRQQTHQTNKQRSLRVFSFGQFRANAFLLRPGIVVTNKHVCDIPDFVLVNNEGVAAVPNELDSSKDFDLCLVKVSSNAKFDYNIKPIEIYKARADLLTRVEILGYSLRNFQPNDLPVLQRSGGETVEIVDLLSGQPAAPDRAEYFNDSVSSTLPIVPGCSGSPIYSLNGILVGVANAMTHERLGVFVQSSNLISYLTSKGLKEGVDYVGTNSAN